MKKALSLILTVIQFFTVATFVGAADSTAQSPVADTSRLYSDSEENIFSTPEETHLYINIINNDTVSHRYNLACTVTSNESNQVVWTGTDTTYGAQPNGGNRKWSIRPQNITEFGEYTLDVVVSVREAEEGAPTYPFTTTFTYVPQGTISTEYAGNIFTSREDMKIDFNFTNTSQNSHSFNAVYEITDERGRIIKNENENLSLASGENHQKVFSSPVERFGIYNLAVTVTDDCGRTYTYDKAFSYVNAPKNMPRKESIGMVSRMVSLTSSSGPDVDASMQIIDNLGVGTIKDGVRWYEYEQSKGVYGLNDTKKERLAKEIAYAQDHGVELWVAFHGDNPDIYNTADKIPRDAEALNALKAAAESFAREYKGQISTFSFTNEPDLSRRQDVLSCEDFAEALRYFSEGIRAGNPDAEIIGVNTSQTNTEWIEGLIRAGAGEYMDAVGIHPYQGPGSPESLKWVEMTSSVREMLSKHGYGHIKVYGTEGNSPESKAYNTLLQQGFNLVRTYALMEATGCIDAFAPHQLYSLLQSGDDENGYGIIEPWADKKNPCSAKPAYVQVCNFSALTADKRNIGLVNRGDVYIHHYAKENGNDVLMMYADRGVRNVSLSINTSKGKMYDTYGNSDEIHALGGKYTFILSDTPTYFEGDFSKFSLTDTGLAIDKPSFELTNGSRGEAQISLENISDYTISAETTDNITATVTDSGSVNITVNEIPEKYEFDAKRQMYGTMDYRDYVNILVKKGDTLYAKLPVAVNYLHKSADAHLYIRPNTTDSGKKWEGVITIRNNKSHESISGTVKIKRPAGISGPLSGAKFDLEPLEPGASESFRFDIYDAWADTYVWCEITLTLSDGEVIEFQLGGHPRSYYYSSGQWTRVPAFQALKWNDDFVIDGKLSGGEWDKYLLKSFEESVENLPTTPDDEQRPDDTGDSEDYEDTVLSDFSGDIYGAWDENFLYIAMEVKDSIHNQHEVPAQMSRADSIAVTTMNTTLQSQNSKYSIALTDYSGERQSVLTTNWSCVPTQPYKGVIPEGENGAMAKVVRHENEGTTIYEARIPWKRLLGRNAVKNDNLKLSLAANDYDTKETASKSYSLTRWTCLTREDEAPMTIVDKSGEAVKSIKELREGDSVTFKASPQSYNGNYKLYLVQYYANKLISTQLSNGKGTGLVYADFDNLSDGVVSVEGNNVTISTNVSNRKRLGLKSGANGNKYIRYETEGFDTVGVTSKPRYSITFNENITEGVTVISFDVGRGDTDGGAFVDSNGTSTDDFLHFRDNDSTSSNRRGFFYASSGNGYMCSGNDSSNAKDTAVTMPYEKNKIYHVDVVFDRDNKKQYTFIDGQLLNDMPYEKAMNASSFQFFISWSVGYFDNLCVKQFASAGKTTLSYEDISRDSLSTCVSGSVDEIRAFVFENNTLVPLMDAFILD